MIRKTKIVCTIGPASESKEMLTELMKLGMNVCRLNFSHGSHEEHQSRINTIKEVRKELNLPVAIMLDTKGPEIRTGKFSADSYQLVEGQSFILTTEDILGDNNRCSVSYKELPRDVEIGTLILIDDGLISMQVEAIEGENITCRVKNNGEIKNNKSINIPNTKINLPAVTQKDVDDIIFGIKNDIDFIAASFVRKAEDVREIRRILEQNDASYIQIISKIENQEGVDKIDEIIRASDGIMVARGDLGVEIPTEEIPLVQKLIIKKSNEQAKPVITATQMLDSMIRNPRPTRAEVTDISNAIFDGTDAIMLSGETAAGKYPKESVMTMSSIASRTEKELNYEKILKDRALRAGDSVTNAIGRATCSTAYDLEAEAIITATSSGYTARMISKFRPLAPIVAATPNEYVRRQLNLVFGVLSIITKYTDNTDELISLSVKRTMSEGIISPGDLVVVTAGVPVGVAGTTNLIKVEIASEIVGKGAGIGFVSVTGSAFIYNRESDKEGFTEGDILVCHSTEKNMMDIVPKAKALIVEEGGLTSHAAIIALELNIPTVVGLKEARERIKKGELLTVDSYRGVVYRGKAHV